MLELTQERMKERKLFEAKVAGKVACKRGKARNFVRCQKLYEIRDEFVKLFPEEGILQLARAWNLGYDQTNGTA